MAHSSIVILTGAGISKESGLDTFRDKDGLWAKVRIEDVATPEAFERDPARVHAFYNERRRGLRLFLTRRLAGAEGLERFRLELPVVIQQDFHLPLRFFQFLAAEGGKLHSLLKKR